VPSETKLSEFAFLIGDRVRVRSGPFASFGGTIVELLKGSKGVDLSAVTVDEFDESYRVHLLVDIFGRSTPVELPVSEIEKI
jgi:transcription antitermination factor NusG